ncbi:MAG: phosphoribosyltransferase family protein [Candidatus Omnitrophica bacterium]|nr:phosphoribosyltransferase family protein [Candidatus Omnitrophota bacterium]
MSPEMRKIDLVDICCRLDATDIGSPDLVLGIAEGGLVPASLAAYKAKAPLRIIKISFRGEKNDPKFNEPVVLNNPEIPAGIKSVLVVDDVSVTGKTLEAAGKVLAGLRVRTMVFKGNADIVLFPEIKECVEWPWKIYAPPITP